MTDERPAQTLAVLDREECLARLAGCRFGRVVAAMADGAPMIRPVNYVFDAGSQSVLIQTRTGSKLHALMRAETATFEIDEIDHDARTGWSVIVSGVVEEVSQPAERARLDALEPSAWAPTEGMSWLRIRAFTVSGRELVSASGSG